MSNVRPLGLSSGRSDAAEALERQRNTRNAFRRNRQLSLIGRRLTDLRRQYPEAPAGVISSLAKATHIPVDHPAMAHRRVERHDIAATRICPLNWSETQYQIN